MCEINSEFYHITICCATVDLYDNLCVPSVHAGKYTVKDLVGPLREVNHSDDYMAYHLWILLFPIVWAALAEKKEQQVQLAKPIILLLQKQHHERQAHHRPNVIQASWSCVFVLCFPIGSLQQLLACVR